MKRSLTFAALLLSSALVLRLSGATEQAAAARAQTPAKAPAQPPAQTPQPLPTAWLAATRASSVTPRIPASRARSTGRPQPAIASRQARMRELPWSRTAHVDDDAKGKITKFKAMKPAEVNGTCLTCHDRGTHAGWQGQRARGAQPLVHDLPSRPQAGVVHAPARQSDGNPAVCDVPPHAGRQDRARRRAHAGARRQDGVLVVPQPARIGQQREGTQSWQLRRRVVHQLSRRDAGAGVVGTRAGQRELRDLPRSARLIKRSHARRPDADALSALSHREQAPGDALRQGRDHHEQEQPDVRAVVSSNCHSNVHGSNHPSGQFFMR